MRAHLHVGDEERDRLVEADRSAERLALPGVPDRLVDGAALGETRRERRDRDPASSRIERNWA
ncbi:MAG: hypothetical protein U0R76_07685 [Candidatus Nanopelagicales bacterium]